MPDYDEIMRGAREESAKPSMVSPAPTAPEKPVKVGPYARNLPARKVNPLIPENSGAQLAERLSEERALAGDAGAAHSPGMGPHRIFQGKKIN